MKKQKLPQEVESSYNSQTAVRTGEERSIEGFFPIKISTPSETFNWDVKQEIDWTVVEAAINSIKERWKTQFKKNNTP